MSRSATSVCLAVMAVAGYISAEVLPAGTRLSVRVSTPLSTVRSAVGDPVHAVLLNSVPSEERPVLAPGLILSGTVREVTAARKSNPARLRIVFDRIRRPEATASVLLDSRVTDVDNAREQVEADGVVRGLKPVRVEPSKKEYVLMAAAYAHPLLLTSVEFTRLLRKEMEKPNFHYAAGTEMTLELSAPLDTAGLSAGAPTGSPEIIRDARVNRLVELQPLRTTAAGLASDQTNLLFIGTAAQLDSAFVAAGWKRAAGQGVRSDLKTFLAAFRHGGYDVEPVSTLTLDGRVPDRVYEKQTNTISKRHHIRIWLRKDTFDGNPVWIGAATHDIGVMFSRQTRNVAHRVESNVDLERTKVLDDLRFSQMVRQFGFIPRPLAARDFHNATGDHLVSDGRMAVIVLSSPSQRASGR